MKLTTDFACGLANKYSMERGSKPLLELDSPKILTTYVASAIYLHIEATK